MGKSIACINLRRDSGRRTWTPLEASLKATSLKVTDLVKNQKYNFRIVAVNKVGAGKAAELPKDIVAKDPMGGKKRLIFI